MSRAFVKEQDGALEELPDRPISEHRNFVTSSGLAKIDATVSGLRDQLADATVGDRPDLRAIATRDLRYWTARRASAELVEPSIGPEVRFGATVTVERADGRRQTFRIVGEDEAEPSEGTLSYVAPLARALTGAAEGDEVIFRNETMTIVKVA